MAKLTVLRENVEHHVEEEEDELFKLARSALAPEEVEELADDLEIAREDIITTG
jgi:predicted DNA-binding protein